MVRLKHIHLRMKLSTTVPRLLTPQNADKNGVIASALMVHPERHCPRVCAHGQQIPTCLMAELVADQAVCHATKIKYLQKKIPEKIGDFFYSAPAKVTAQPWGLANII